MGMNEILKERYKYYNIFDIVFIQGEEANKPLKILDKKGKKALFQYLSQWDYGDNTKTDEIMGNSDNYIDEFFPYIINYNERLRYVGMVRLMINNKKNIPLYGYISYLGNYYSIDYKREGDKDNCHSLTGGMGEFPFNQYPNLPVINFFNNHKVFNAMNFTNKVLPNEYNKRNKGTVETYLKAIKKQGIEIINYPYEE